MRKRPFSMGCLVMISMLCLVMSVVQKQTKQDKERSGSMLELQGTVYQKELQQKEDRDTLVIYLKDISVVGQDEMRKDSSLFYRASDRVICYCEENTPEPSMGSVVTVRGTLRFFEEPSNPGQFNAPLYYQILRISFRLNRASIQKESQHHSWLGEGLYRIRRKLSQRIGQLLPQEEASIMKTMLLGEKGVLDEEMKGLYQRNGIAHILAISGLHISVLGVGLYQLLRRVGVKIVPACVISSVFIVLYGMMTGFSVSAVRAIAMFLLQMLAECVGRTYDMITAVAAAAVLLLVSQPLYLFHTGFLFSFVCVLGISLLQPVLCNVRNKLLKKLLSGMSMTVVTFPVYLKYFYQIPVYSMFLNFMVLPLMSILMGAGIVMLLMSCVYLPLGIPAGYVVVGILTIYKKLGLCFEKLPLHLWTPGAPSDWQLMSDVLILVVIALFGRTRIKEKRYRRERAAAGERECSIRSTYRYLVRYGIPVRFCWCFAAVGIVVLSLRFRPALLVTFLDVGQGDCIFIQEQDGTSYLVDGGSSSVSEVGKYRILPFLKVQGADRVKAVFVSHADSDHCNGICELLTQAQREGMIIENLVLPDLAEAGKEENYRELVTLARQQDIPVSYLHAGQSIQEGDVIFRCMHPDAGYVSEDANEASMVLYATYQDFSLLLTGDVEGQGENLLTERLQEEAERAVVQQSQGENVSVAVQQTDMWVQSEEEVENGYKTGAQKTTMQVDVLKVAHHGSRYSTTEAFLQTVNPAVAVISCGATNSYGHPHEETLERLTQAEVTWFSTKDYGAVSVIVERNGAYRIQGYRPE